MVILGPLRSTKDIKKLIQDQCKQNLPTGPNKEGKWEAVDSSKYNFSIHAYEYHHVYRSKSNPGATIDLPVFYQEQQNGYHSGLFKKSSSQHELGYIKQRFFDSITIFKPAITLMVFDWQNSALSWSVREQQVLDEIKFFQEKCPITSKDTKIIIFIMLHPADGQIDECKNNIKTAMKQRNLIDENSNVGVKPIFCVKGGVNGLRNNPKDIKDLMKKIFDQSSQYYGGKKREIKNKQKKLQSKELTENARYSFKIGIYSQLSKGDLQSSFKHIEQAYNNLKWGMGNSYAAISKQSLDEKRENADIICLQMLCYLHEMHNYEAFFKLFRSHFHTFKNSFEQINQNIVSTNSFSLKNSQLKLEELKWRSNWHNIIAQMLEAKPIVFHDSQNIYHQQRTVSTKSKLPIQTQWLSDLQAEQYYGGYHHLNCMLSLIKRKRELTIIVQGQKNESDEPSKLTVYTQLQLDLKEIMLLEKSKMIGKEYTLGKNTNPLLEQSQQSIQGVGGSLGLSTAQTQTLLEKAKLLEQIEGMDDLNKEILRAGQSALGSYKIKNQLMSGYNYDSTTNNYRFLKAQCKRMLQFIHFHLSDHIFELKREYDLIQNSKSPLGQIYHPDRSILNNQVIIEAQKYRDTVTAHLIQDGWQMEAIGLCEENRWFQEMMNKEQKRPQQFFEYEMQILNYSKSISKSDRQNRFLELLNLDFNSETLTEPILGQLVGANLIWVRAQFDKKANEQVQINKWVKLTVEIFTKIKGEGVEIETVSSRFNEQKFNFDYKGQKISRDKPLKFTQDIYLDEALILNGEILVLNSIFIKIANKPILFALQPYLTAKDKIRGKMDKKGAGLKQPVLLNIQEMAPQLNFKFIQDNSHHQALQGSRHRIDIYVNKMPNINLKTLSIQFDEIKQVDTILQGQGSILPNQSQIMSEIDMQSSQTAADTNASFFDQQRHPAVSSYNASLSRSNQVLHQSTIQVSRKATIKPNMDQLAINQSEFLDQSATVMTDHPFAQTQIDTKVNNFFDQEEVKSEEGDMQRLGSTVMQRGNEQKDYEIEYQFSSQNLSDNIYSLDYPNDHTIEILNENILKIKEENKDTVDSELPLVSVYFTFYNQAINQINLKFFYTFTQIHKAIDQEDQKEQVEFSQDYSHDFMINSIQPFEIEWALIMSSDAFIKNKKLPKQELVTSLDKKFKVCCKFKNKSACKVLQVSSAQLEMNLAEIEEDDEFKDIKMQIIKLMPEDLTQFSLDPGEQIECVSQNITINSDQIEKIFQNQGANLPKMSQGRSQMINANQALGFQGVGKIKKVQGDFHTAFIVQSPFKLNFSWIELNSLERVDYSNRAQEMPIPLHQTIYCSITSFKSLNLFQIPISIELLGGIAQIKDGCPQTPLKLEQPVQAQYRIKNLCEDHIFECVALLDDQSKFFFSSGEIRTKFDIMPLDEVILEYQLFPLTLGYHDLPKLHIVDRSVTTDALKLQFRKLNDPAYIHQFQTEKNQIIQYLIHGFTTKVFVQQ